MKFAVQVTDCGPLSFRKERETTSSASFDYIPGSILRGVLATVYAQLHNDVRMQTELFLDEGVSFGNLYPSEFESEELEGSIDPVYPIPTTAASCKRFSGFRFDEVAPEQPHHGVQDTLIPWTLFCLSQRSRSDVLWSLAHCPHDLCNQSLDRFTGFYRRDPFDPTNIGKARIRKGLRTRTGIDRATGGVHQSILYSREILQPGMTFWGTTTIPDKHADAFATFVQTANASGLVRLGNNRTRGFGSVTLQVEPLKDDDTSALRQRISTFNSMLRTQAKNYNVDTPHELYLPITFTSDTIIYDRLLRQRTLLDAGALSYLGIRNAELIYHNNSIRQIMGWNNLWRTPKENNIAITMGSVFLFGLSHQLDDDLLQIMLRLQNNGIGVRRQEGFGRLLIADSFHWEVHE